MTPKDKVMQLKQLIADSLTPLINNDYLLLDLPYHSNLGDTLIWQGELDFLKTLPYKCRYSTYFDGNIIIAGEKLRHETIILFHGGGNFGDIWEEPHAFRKKVLMHYPKQRTIILPQTIYYQNHNRLLEDAEFYSRFPNVTICARDICSLELLKKYFPNNPSFLVPDMAFFMDITKYGREKYPQGSIFIKRDDKEYANNVDYSHVPDDASVSDWLFLSDSKMYYRQQSIIKWGIRFDKLLGTDWKHRLLDSYWYHILRPLNVKTAIRFIDQYESVYTTRMHAAILSVILEKNDITMFDNNYGKTSSLYCTWLSDVVGLRME